MTASPLEVFVCRTIRILLQHVFLVLLLNICYPVRTFYPLFVDAIVTTVVFHLPEEVVQPVHEIRVAFVDGPSQRLKSKGLVQKKPAFPYPVEH